MISDSDQLFRVDESALHRFINSFDDHLKRHDEQIAELQRLLRDVPSRNDLNQIRDDFDRKLGQVKDSLSQKIDDNNHSLNDRINRLKDDTDDKLSSLNDSVDRKISQLSDGLNSRVSKVEAELEKLKNQLSELSNKKPEVEIDADEINDSIKKINDMATENREYIQTIATSYALVNKTQAPLGPTLQRTLYSTSDYIARNIKRLSDGLKALQQQQQTGAPQQTVIAAPDIDLSSLKYNGTEIPAEFSEAPKLPPIRKFDEVPEVVQYLYDSVPRLQGYLNALHDRVLNMNDSDFDPSIFNNLMETVRKALNDMAAELDQLKKARNKPGLTRADVMKMIRDMLAEDDEYEGYDTSVGYVKCIACGRETRQVVGAMTEDQAIRTLGAPPNSVALFPYVGEKSIGQMFANSDQVDKSYLESPRSKRPKRFNSRKFKPHPPS